MQNFRYLKNVATVRFDTQRCVGCGRCPQVCPHGVFTMEGDRARLVDADACIECGACARNCPVAAITVDAGVGCASGMINEWLQEKGFWRSKGGC